MAWRGSVLPLVRLLNDGDPTVWLEAASAFSEVVAQDVGDVVQQLSAEDGEVRRSAVATLASLLAKEENCAEMVQEGAIPCLVRLLRDSDLEVQEPAAQALATLAECEANSLAIAREGAVPTFIWMLEQTEAPDMLDPTKLLQTVQQQVQQVQRGEIHVGERDPRVSLAREHAVRALANLAYDGANARAMGAEAVPSLVQLLRGGEPELQRSAALALANLAFLPEHRQRVGRSGAIPFLVQLLEDENPEVRICSAGALLNLCEDEESALQMLEQGAAQPLLLLLEEGDPALRQSAAATLEGLGRFERNRVPLAREGVIPLLVQLLHDREPAVRQGATDALSSLAGTRSQAVPVPAPADGPEGRPRPARSLLRRLAARLCCH